jgi:hypothetical protein
MATPVKKRRRIRLDIDKPKPPPKPAKGLRPGVVIPVVVVIIVMIVVIGRYRKQQAEYTQIADTMTDTAFRPMVQQQIANEVRAHVLQNEQFPADVSVLPSGRNENLSALIPNFRLQEIAFDRFAVLWLGPDGLNQITPEILTTLQAAQESAWHDSGDDTVLLVFYDSEVAPVSPTGILPPGLPPLPGQ